MGSASDSGIQEPPGVDEQKLEVPEPITLKNFFKAIVAKYRAIATAKHAPESPTQ